MPPREPTNCDLDMSVRITGRAGVQGIRKVNGTSSRMNPGQRAAGKGNAAAPIANAEIPWRTSRRLQEATLRLIKERDGGQPQSHVTPKEEEVSRSSESLPPEWSGRRRRWESEASGGEKQEDQVTEISVEVDGNQSVTEPEKASSAETVATPLRFRGNVKRKRKAQLNDVHLFMQDETKAVAGDAKDEHIRNDVASPRGKARSNRAARREDMKRPACRPGIPQTNFKQPQSCFDLHCSHVGLRGWRCYRSRIVGHSFCVYHRRESTPAVGICVYT